MQTFHKLVSNYFSERKQNSYEVFRAVLLILPGSISWHVIRLNINLEIKKKRKFSSQSLYMLLFGYRINQYAFFKSTFYLI